MQTKNDKYEVFLQKKKDLAIYTPRLDGYNHFLHQTRHKKSNKINMTCCVNQLIWGLIGPDFGVILKTLDKSIGFLKIAYEKTLLNRS